MNEKVTDISEALLTMTEEMRLMRETIDSQHAEICNLNRKTEALHQEIRCLKKENEALHEQLAKYETPEKNSGTFRSDAGANAFLDLLSIVETTKKHNNSPYAAIRALF